MNDEMVNKETTTNDATTNDAMTTVVVLCALSKETAPFVAVMDKVVRADEGGCVIHVGWLTADGNAEGISTSDEAAPSEQIGELPSHADSLPNALRLVVVEGGMGTVAAGAAAQLAITRFKPVALLFSGIAGGLNPQLGVRDVVVGQRLEYLETNRPIIAECAPWLEHFSSDPALVDAACAALDKLGALQVPSLSAADRDEDDVVDDLDTMDSFETVDGSGVVDGFDTEVSQRDNSSDGSAVEFSAGAVGGCARRYARGVIASSNQFNTDPAVLDMIRRDEGADCEEMEGTATAHIAAKNGVPFLAVRGISNRCGEAYETLDDHTQDLFAAADIAAQVTIDVLKRQFLS